MDKKRFFTKKKLFIFGGILLFLILFCYFLYRFCYFYVFNINDSTYDDKASVTYKGDVNIKHDEFKGKYFEFNNVKFLNSFNDCYLNLKNDNNRYIYICNNVSVDISKRDEFVSSFSKDSSKYILVSSDGVIFNNFFDRHNIHNDVDLIKFLESYKKKDTNIFSSYFDIDDKYVVYNSIFTFSVLDDMDFYTISGYYSGFVLEGRSNYYFYLKSNDGYYLFSFKIADKNISRDDVYKVISSVVMD